VKALIIVLLIVLGACGDDKSTRTQAERVLMGDKDFTARTAFACLGPNCPVLETEEALATLGYVTMRRRDRFSAEIVLTEKGRANLENLQIKSLFSSDGPKQRRIAKEIPSDLARTRYAGSPLAAAGVMEITGVFHKGEGLAEVEFTWVWEPNAVGAELLGLRKSYIGVGPHKLKKTFKRYDDGWRIDWEEKKN